MTETSLIKRQEITITELSRYSSKCVQLAVAGFEVIITDHNTPVVRMVCYDDEVKMIPLVEPSQIKGLPPYVEDVFQTHPLAFLLVCQAFLRMRNPKGKLVGELVRLCSRLRVDQLREVTALANALLSPKAAARAAQQPSLLQPQEQDVSCSAPAPSQEAPEDKPKPEPIKEPEPVQEPASPRYHRKETVVSFFKSEQSTSPITPYQCHCYQMGCRVTKHFIRGWKGEFEESTWVGEPGDKRLYYCRDCGWGMVFLHRRGGGYSPMDLQTALLKWPELFPEGRTLH